MKRKILLYLLVTFLLATISDSQAQQARIYRVGVMVVGSAEIPQIKGLRDGLSELGYIPGKNLALDVLAEETYEEYRPLVRSYKAKKPDVIVTIGGTATSVVKEIAPEIATVFYFGSDPVQAGFVKSIAHPESNLSGVTYHTDAEFEGKRLGIFHETVRLFDAWLYSITPEAKIPPTKCTLIWCGRSVLSWELNYQKHR